MGDLGDILASRDYGEPPEIAAIKRYVSEKFDSKVSVAIRDDSIVITAPSASLANVLRLHGPQITRECDLKQRLIFRIG